MASDEMRSGLDDIACEFAREVVPHFSKFAHRVSERAWDDTREVADVLTAFDPFHQALEDFLDELLDLSKGWEVSAADFGRFLDAHPELCEGVDA